jgi:signal transduction histidine kinase
LDYQYIPQILPLVISGIMTIFLGTIVLLGQRTSKTAFIFALNMLVVTLWSLPNALEMMAVNLPTKLFWADIQYFAYCYSPITLLALCMVITGYDEWIKSKKIVWLAVLPTIVILLVWTNRFHGLIRYDVYLKSNGVFLVIMKKYGIAFYLHAIYSHTINIISMIVLIKSLLFDKRVYRKQIIAMLIAANLIIIPNIIYILGWSPLKYDVTPVFFGPAGLITMWAIFRYKLFNLVPVMRASVMEHMDTGIMVLDLQDRILDINPAFMKMTKMPKVKYYEAKPEDIFGSLPELIGACKNHSMPQLEFKINQNVYETLLSPLNDEKGNSIGRLVVIHDITEKKRVQQEFLKQQWILAGVKERERMARDMHDNLGQLLGFINFQAQGIRQELILAEVNMVTDQLDKLIEVAQMAHKEIRKYIAAAGTSVNSEQDFIREFKKMICIFKAQAGFHISLEIPYQLAGEQLRPYQWINILNIIKEALNNVQKHAEAKNVNISFHTKEKQLITEIEDDGKGFDIINHANEENAGYGLGIMKERAEEINGKFNIESEKGKGTRVILTVPLEKGEMQNADEANAG